MTVFEDMGLTFDPKEVEIKVNGDVELSVRTYLPIDEKADFVQYVVANSIDNDTGCFSPLRVEVFYALAVCKWYGQIELDEDMRVSELYDLLDSNYVVSDIIHAIPNEEIEYMNSLVNDTVKDIARYNASAAGIIQNMSKNAGGLDQQLNDILSKMQSEDGRAALNAFKDVVENG